MTEVSKCNSQRSLGWNKRCEKIEDIGREGLGWGLVGFQAEQTFPLPDPTAHIGIERSTAVRHIHQPRRSLIHPTKHISNEMSELWSPKDLANMPGMPIIERKVRKRAAPGRFAERLQDTRNVAPCRMKTRLHP